MANLMPNGTFEANITGWSAQGSAALSRSTAQKRTGAASMLVDSSATSDGANSDTITGVVANTVYYFTIWVYLITGPANIRTGWNQLTSSDGYITTDAAVQTSIPATTWTKIEFSQQVASNCAKLQPFISCDSSVRDYYVDDVTLDTVPQTSLTLDDCLPDADVTTTGWTTTPLFSKINDSSDATVIQSTSMMRIVGYVDGYRDISTVRWDYITDAMILYAIIHTDASVEIRTVNNFAECVTQAHANDCNVLLSLGAESSSDWKTTITTAGHRTSIVNAVIGHMNTYGFDGIDIDLEIPYAADYANWKLLVQELKAALPVGKLLSVAITAGVEAYATAGDSTFIYRVATADADHYENSVLELFDFLNVMAYDGHYVYTHSPAQHSPYEYFVASLTYWMNRGIAVSRLMMGVPFYGVLTNDGVNTDYVTLLAQGANPNLNIWNGWYYNGIPLITQKTNYAKTNGAGMMLFHMKEDSPTYSLAQAVWNTGRSL